MKNSNSNPYSHPQSMHHYLYQMRGWLKNIYRNNEKKKENIKLITKRQQEYDKMLQQKDAQNKRFKQFFKQLKEKTQQ